MRMCWICPVRINKLEGGLNSDLVWLFGTGTRAAGWTPMLWQADGFEAEIFGICVRQAERERERERAANCWLA